MKYWHLWYDYKVMLQWVKQRVINYEINEAYRQMAADQYDPNHHFMVVEEGTDLSTIPAPIGKP